MRQAQKRTIDDTGKQIGALIDTIGATCANAPGCQ
jgi:hypothetical protein